MTRYNVLLQVARPSFGVGKLEAKDENDARAKAICMATEPMACMQGSGTGRRGDRFGVSWMLF